MTTKWEVTRMWEGETVAILGAGQDMTPDLAESARVFKTIAVSRAVKFAPWADLFVGLDPVSHDGLDFAGLRVCGVECDADALYAGMMYERVTLGEGNVVEIRNNALAAIRIAARAGAAKILLLGLDPERYDAMHAESGFAGLTAGLEQITAELRAAGVEVERIDPMIAAEPLERKGWAE